MNLSDFALFGLGPDAIVLAMAGISSMVAVYAALYSVYCLTHHNCNM